MKLEGIYDFYQDTKVEDLIYLKDISKSGCFYYTDSSGALLYAEPQSDCTTDWYLIRGNKSLIIGISYDESGIIYTDSCYRN